MYTTHPFCIQSQYTIHGIHSIQYTKQYIQYSKLSSNDQSSEVMPSADNVKEHSGQKQVKPYRLFVHLLTLHRAFL